MGDDSIDMVILHIDMMTISIRDILSPCPANPGTTLNTLLG
jgi:hypothetical protein